jgi:hypothetical protein
MPTQKMELDEAISILKDLESELDEFPEEISRDGEPELSVPVDPLREKLIELNASLLWNKNPDEAWEEWVSFRKKLLRAVRTVDRELERVREQLHCHDVALMELESLQVILDYYIQDRHILDIHDLLYLPDLVSDGSESE